MNGLKQGSTLQGGKYRIESILGQGGFGITYKAVQMGLNRTVAVKEFFMKDYCIRSEDSGEITLSTSEAQLTASKFRAKFVKEAQLIASLNNPSIINIFDIFEENGTAYYVMEFLNEGTLRDLLRRCGKLPEKQALAFIRNAGKALSFVHDHHILHLDVKPANMMLRGTQNVVLIDFGISKRYDDGGGQTSTTPAGLSIGFAPIEQYKQGGLQHFSPATDVYSLGATFFNLLTGTLPPDSATLLENPLPEIKGVSKEINDAIHAAMQVRRADRPQTVEAFLSMLPSEILPQQSNNEKNVSDFRATIEQLERDMSYREAYNLCLEQMRNGQDTEWTKAKMTELVPHMKKQYKNNEYKNLIISFIIAVVVTLFLFILRS